MFYEFFKYLDCFQACENIIFRALGACFTSMFIGVSLFPYLIRKLQQLKIKQSIRIYGPKSHLVKEGIPTMGGLIILISIFISSFFWTDLNNKYIWTVSITMILFGTIGFFDDFIKVVYNNPEGISAKLKLLLQIVSAVIIAFVIVQITIDERSCFSYDLLLPFFKSFNWQIGVITFIFLTVFVIVGTSNAVNLTDGLDGLVSFPVILVSGALGIFAYIIGNETYSSTLLFPYVNSSNELLVLCAAIIGSELAFLWFNAHPATVFMGDVGSLSLGATLGVISIIVRQEITLVIMGGIFVVEAVSVMIQVFWFKYSKKRYGVGRRFFKMTPLHHHFEIAGWKETQVVVRFWIINIILVLISLSSLIL
ncbi:phospho-N-acetylmuramoyl-pentapeptide-transferase [Candidatus Kinetoplastidibacterium crithidiae]|uniref:Phospho-N-acetylmuramoyl-pentapeptide-transferase n=1 Tax=Candidatus Kinetoplastidibacterium crithidiae TCC036E TaxID=1208918 RepID=M1M6Z3_9PROT|nr:phospho-N-acetylmuramoyl-pentapeptide-transferase [Candidatus Kinetoplastibacterium crithidii]AFZ82484.1 phospho-N-acetylmuramoyl-pentapeptide-transferase [Candidatus Kinetoplastibacterium crithidii (ex Angomonas deanei ATCC 30255)]AGF47855.1 phospho-N-acetylmuramoyl-pentapeptide-transferase [Candidatus Kinetoplastibacterium crithidii TCC036E]